MDETEDLVKNTSENPVNKGAAGAENPVNEEAAGAENPANERAGGSVNPVNVHADVAESSVNNQADGAENPATHQSDGAVNLVKDLADGAENPPKDLAGCAENSVKDQQADAENSVKDQQADAENPIKDKIGGVEDPSKDQVSSPENPVNHKDEAGNFLISEAGSSEKALTNTVGNIENSAHDKVTAENAVVDIACGTENPVNDKGGSVENPLENSAHDKVAAENTVVDIACGTENPVNDKGVSIENPLENSAQDKVAAENAVVDIAYGTENSVNDKTGSVENPLENSAHYKVAAENAVVDIACGTENSVNDKTGSVENPLENSAHYKVAAENAVVDIACGTENPVNDTAGSVENPSENSAHDKVAAENTVVDIACGTENPVNDKAGSVENSLDKKEIAEETPVNKADRLPQEVKEILKSLASEWDDVLDANALQVFPLKGAMTNEVYQIKWNTTAGETSRKVIVRIYGEGVDIFFNRDDEIRTFEFMSKHGQGPRLLGRFKNGRVEEFIRARTLSASDLRDPSISALIATKMKEFHELDMPGEKKVHLWDRLRNWLAEAKCLSSPKEVEAFYLDTIDKEISLLEKELSSADKRIGFCHNDLQYGNIMLDEETNAVTIIDYEYASYNPVAYDIANHFCEMSANYHTETPHILEYSKYPDVEERKRFVQAYLSSSGDQPKDSEVEQLLQDIEKYTLANHLFWGVWGIISAQVNKIDFDYKEYAKQRFQEYWGRKPYLLSYDAPSPYNAPEGTGDLATASTTTTTKGSTKNTIFRKMKRVLGLSIFKSKN